MDWIPIRIIRWEENSEGRVTLLKRKFRHAWLIRLVQKMGKEPDLKIHLDEYGSLVWLACDGKRSVWQICQILQEHIKTKDDSMPQRTLRFLQSLLGQSCIRFEESD